jgi:hypothetical protein
MALVDHHFAKITFGDSQSKEFTVRFRVASADAAAYFGAVTQILKDATDLGQMFLSFEDLSAGTFRGKGVELVTIDDAIGFPAPDDNQYGFDKLLVSYGAGGFNYNLSIPVRDDTVYSVGTDGITVILADGAEVEDFVTRFNGIVLSKYGVAGTVNEITVSQ